MGSLRSASVILTSPPPRGDPRVRSGSLQLHSAQPAGGRPIQNRTERLFVPMAVEGASKTATHDGGRCTGRHAPRGPDAYRGLSPPTEEACKHRDTRSLSQIGLVGPARLLDPVPALITDGDNLIRVRHAISASFGTPRTITVRLVADIPEPAVLAHRHRQPGIPRRVAIVRLSSARRASRDVRGAPVVAAVAVTVAVSCGQGNGYPFAFGSARSVCARHLPPRPGCGRCAPLASPELRKSLAWLWAHEYLPLTVYRARNPR